METGINRKHSSNVLTFLSIVGKLKQVKRAGWVRHEVNAPESVSDHMYRMAVMCFLIDGNSQINKDRCMKIAIVHDLAESLVGDITPFDNVTKEEKLRREKAAMSEICKLLDDETGKEIFNLWQEYEHQISQEAKVVKDLDVFEMLLQAHEYERDQDMPGRLEDFFTNTRGSIKSEFIQAWENELLEMRKDHK